MKKAGLQKKIAFIFDGEEPQDQKNHPVQNPCFPKETPAAAPHPSAGESAFLFSKNVDSVSEQAVHGSTQYGAAPKRPSIRPQPVPTKTVAAANSITLQKTVGLIKNRTFVNRADKRQKKMAVLVALLSLAFVAMLYFALGTGPSLAEATPQNTNSNQTTVSTKKLTDSWKIPESYSPLRDPMLFAPKQIPEGGLAMGGLVVKGIVYTPQKPSAIISGQVLVAGESISGILVHKIEKDVVEFEKDGKRWKQQVEQ